MRRPLAIALSLVALAACSRRGVDGASDALPSGKPADAPFDWERPAAALSMDGDAAARRLGSFDWTGAVDWTFTREAMRVHVAEHHRVRQAATGEFEVESRIDPGQGPGAESGRTVIWAGGMTYARGRFAPFRERPTDRGRDARRARDESFRMAGDLAALLGPGLTLQAAGETTALGRPARRFTVSLVQAPAEPAPQRPAPPDDDTKRRLAFLEGRVPLSASGELVADAQSGVPLRVQLEVAFGVKDDPAARAHVELLAQVRTVGGEVAAVTPPKGALPDARKPPGVTAALEAAGLKKPPETEATEKPPADEVE